ncbi:MAG: hypothetical protein HGB03_02055 [Candidatus Yonathbacteria bacterium]|nr:hypothetical protein [Candidatus Yonathbacteria bacterium]NTW48038.1 hypothetical protein [Candidatus Yonathbacteria bacterium]
MTKIFFQKHVIFLVTYVVGAFPLFVFAAPGTFSELATMLVEIIDVAVPVIVTLALVAFLFGLAKMLFSAGDSASYSEGSKIMVYGIVSLFVIVALWGLIEVAQQTIFETTSTEVPQTPDILGTSSTDIKNEDTSFNWSDFTNAEVGNSR